MSSPNKIKVNMSKSWVMWCSLFLTYTKKNLDERFVTPAGVYCCSEANSYLGLGGKLRNNGRWPPHCLGRKLFYIFYFVRPTKIFSYNIKKHTFLPNKGEWKQFQFTSMQWTVKPCFLSLKIICTSAMVTIQNII